MQYRNARYTADGRIDCEVNHPRFGWIPYTTSPDDEVSKDLFAELDASNQVAAYEPPAPEPVTVGQVKAEARRRIIAICPEWKQRNLTAQAAILAKKGPENWTAEEQAAWDAGEALWTQIAAIRAKSDQIEVMDPIPQDYRDDGYWT